MLNLREIFNARLVCIKLVRSMTNLEVGYIYAKHRSLLQYEGSLQSSGFLLKDSL